MINATSYFTNGLCVPDKPLDAISYFTLGLVAGDAVEGKQDSGPQMSRNRMRMIREDNEIIRIIQTFLDDVIG